MRPTKVLMQRTINTGNYENVRLGVELELDEGETAAAALERARAFIDQQARQYDPNVRAELEQWREKSKRMTAVLHDPDSYSLREQQSAHNWLETHPRPVDPDEATEPIL